MGDKCSGGHRGQSSKLGLCLNSHLLSLGTISLIPLCSYTFWWFQEDFPHNAHHREISISVSNYTLKHGDAGLVIVGGRMEMQPHVCLDLFCSWFLLL